MNNDFNFKPRNTETPQNKASQQPLTPEQPEPPTQSVDTAAADTNDTITEAPVQSPQITTSKQPSGKAKGFFKFLGLLLLIALIGGGVYYWQQMRIKDLAASHAALEKKVSTLNSQVATDEDDHNQPSKAAAAKTESTTYNIITGSVTSNAAQSADVSVQYLPDTATEVWVEYGAKPDDLKQTTNRVKGTSAGTAGSYIDQAFSLNSLQAGTQYYYRAAGTVDGKTVYGGVTTFKAVK